MNKILAGICLCCFAVSGLLAQQAGDPAWPANKVLSANKILSADKVWPAIKKEMRPWARWWWMGSAVDDSNLDRLLVQYHEAGFGGMEITPIYGAVGYERRYVDFLSPKWMDRLSFAVNKAGALGMGMDMNTGTGWPFGGPQVSREHAAARLVVRSFVLSAGDTLADGALRGREDPLQALTAYGDKGEVLSLLDKVDASGKLSWSPVAGRWTVMAAWSGKTGQQVKRAAPGGEGYVMDHFDKGAVEGYLQRFSDAFGGKSPGVRAFFNDSYEVYGADWTPGLFDYFLQRKGYDLRVYLRELVDSGGITSDRDAGISDRVAGISDRVAGTSDRVVGTSDGVAGTSDGVAGTSDRVARIKSDYREVYGEMLLHNFSGVWNDWAHRSGAISRNQAHGSPANILDLYGRADIPECEGFFGVSDFAIPGLRKDPADVRNQVVHNPVMFQFASSAAHFYGKPLVSSETFVWLTEHFRTTPARCKPEVEQLFLAGINHVFFHGATYSPKDVPWPGWTFYASSEFNPSNSLWPQLSAMNGYITRCQSVLQAGKPDNQLLVYWPVYDVWSDPKGMEVRFAMNNVEEWLYPTAFSRSVTALRAAGYSMDFVSDKMIGETGGKADKRMILVVPACRLIPVGTLKNIFDMARKGALVLFEALPGDVPGWEDVDKKRKEFRELLSGLAFVPVNDNIQEAQVGSGRVVVAADLAGALAYEHVKREDLADLGLQFIRRDMGDGKYYYIVNHTAGVIDRYVPLNVPPGEAVLMDPQSGDYGMGETSGAGVVKDRQNGNNGLVTVSGYDGPRMNVHLQHMNVHLQLQPGEAMIVRTYSTGRGGAGAGRSLHKDGPAAGETPVVRPWVYLGRAGKSRSVGGPWSLSFVSGGPVLPAARKLDSLSYWDLLQDSAAVAFSGTGVYAASFRCPDLSAGEYLLELKGVRESAHVQINGKEAGILWSHPFRMRIKKYLRPGMNTIRIEVVNLMANRIRDMDLKRIPWRNYHEINFVNIQYQPFDASGWKSLESGLSGPVTITPYLAGAR